MFSRFLKEYFYAFRRTAFQYTANLYIFLFTKINSRNQRFENVICAICSTFKTNKLYQLFVNDALHYQQNNVKANVVKPFRLNERTAGNMGLYHTKISFPQNAIKNSILLDNDKS
jgi:hypothetical protein